MIYKYLFKILIATLFFSVSNKVYGENISSNLSDNKTESIFNQILQALPDELKDDFDSAKTVREHNCQNSTNLVGNKEIKHYSPSNKTGAISNLPKEIQMRVEKEIKNINKRQQNRKLEFLEINK